MIRAVIFDMFETLVSLFDGRTYFSEHTAAELGVAVDDFRGQWHTTEEARSIGTCTVEEGFVSALKALNMYSSERVRDIEGKRQEMLRDTFAALPEESLWLLRELKSHGIRTGLISNCYSDEREWIVNSPIYPLMDVAMLSYEQGVCKPDPEIYLRAAAALGVKPEECLYVGDGGSRELFAARDVGMHPIQVTWYRGGMYEPHIPSPVYEEFPQAAQREEILEAATGEIF